MLGKEGGKQIIGISGLGMPLLAAPLLCFTGAIIPLAVPFLMQGHISAIGVVAAIAISTTIVDTSPFSTNGALVVTNAPEAERDDVLRKLLIYSALIAVIGPLSPGSFLSSPALSDDRPGQRNGAGNSLPAPHPLRNV